MTATVGKHPGPSARSLRHVLVLAVALAASAVRAEAPENRNVLDLPLEQLLDMEVTSVSRKPQRLSDTAAAAFVITRDDIRRSGATHVAEALRMAPGVNVARISANSWAVSIRGFNGASANKLQVMVDGRTVYSPIFSGVHWGHHDVMLDDVERIEVIRGPGGAVWGANAVNGVINIITRHAAHTQGLYAQLGGGQGEKGFAELRYGGTPAPDTYYRVYGRAARSNVTGADSAAHVDPWQSARTGFRFDKTLDAASNLTVHGDVFETSLRYDRQAPITVPPWSASQRVLDRGRGANLRASWSSRRGDVSDSVQAYVDRHQVDTGYFDVEYTTVDVEGQRQLKPAADHDLVFGLGLRWVGDNTRGTEAISFQPAKRNTRLLTAFVSDDITLRPDTLRLTLGTRFEHNDYTGFEIQPNARLWWRPADGHALWGALSRAVRTPSRAEADARYVYGVLAPGSAANPSPLPVVLSGQGSPDYKAERLLAWEAGYRNTVSPVMSFDATMFHNLYHGLRTGQPGAPVAAGQALITPVNVLNGPAATSTGFEAALDWRATAAWRLVGAYTNLRVRVDDGVTRLSESTGAGAAGATPTHQVSLRSSHDLGRHTSLDFWVRHVGALPALGIERYTVLDARLAWLPRRDLELALTARNLGRRHVEYVTEIGANGLGAVIDRSVFASVRLWY